MGSGLSKKAEERISTAKKNKSKEINLKDCQLKKLPHVVKTALKGLKILNISQNYIIELPPAIGNFVDLEEFYCDTNEIAELPSELFTLKKLLILNVARNPLTSLPDQYIAELGALTTLDLSGTSIVKLPPNLGKLQSLTTYIHQSCGLEEVPPQLLHLKNLRVLDLSINKISTLPVDFDKLVNLERLDLSNNRLTKLETQISALTNLRTLILNNNPLIDVSTFPFSKLGNLLELHMNECLLEKISQDIGTLTKLQVLELGINRLKVIPRQIGHIGTGLRRINLRSNQIEDVPGEFSFFEPAVDLDLSNNPLRGQQQMWLDQGAPVLIENLAPFTKAWAAHCECTGDSLNTVPAKQGVSFMINAKDFKGKKRTTGNDKFDVLFVRQGSELDVGDSKYYQNEGIVKDLKNGSYEVFFNLAYSGNYKVTVLCEGVEIKGSPYTMTVI
eukprot:TRINITY_DN3785_c0_g1_i1.p1 TRINITY_DN3785_c0_g1~~TRINITY_DN3785_c0_g1_i1.p1  ORF type:complete len:460 (+),score=92.49 TRINITY_DN3785_c0_g1_i1:48-1382(+)